MKKKTYFDPKHKSEPVQQQRAAHKESVSVYDVEQFIFLDDKGQRTYGEKPTAKEQCLNTLGALSAQGLMAALCFEGTLNGPVFLYT